MITKHTYIHTYLPTYVRTYVRTYIHTYTHTHIHTYLCTYSCTYIRNLAHREYAETVQDKEGSISVEELQKVWEMNLTSRWTYSRLAGAHMPVAVCLPAWLTNAHSSRAQHWQFGRKVTAAASLAVEGSSQEH